MTGNKGGEKLENIVKNNKRREVCIRQKGGKGRKEKQPDPQRDKC